MKTNKLIYSLVSILLMAGCSKDFLNKKKLGASTTDTFFPSEVDAFQSVVAAYSDLKDYRYIWTIWAFGDVLSDDATYSGSEADVQSYSQMEKFNYQADNGRLLNRWQILYRGINKANQSIEGISKMTDAQIKANVKNRLLAEALFLRAYYYHELVRAFGDVVLLTKVATMEDKTKTRTPVAEVYAQIEKDLIEAAKYLPKKSDLSMSSEAGRITRGAANAMLARVYLYQKKYKDCKDACTEVFKDGYELEPNYSFVFSLAGEHCKESIFEIDLYLSLIHI